MSKSFVSLWLRMALVLAAVLIVMSAVIAALNVAADALLPKPWSDLASTSVLVILLSLVVAFVALHTRVRS